MIQLSTDTYCEILSFLTRNQLDVISLVDRRSKNLVQHYFPSNRAPLRAMHELMVGLDKRRKLIYELHYDRHCQNVKTFRDFKFLQNLQRHQRIIILGLHMQNLNCDEKLYENLYHTFDILHYTATVNKTIFGKWTQDRNNKLVVDFNHQPSVTVPDHSRPDLWFGYVLLDIVPMKFSEDKSFNLAMYLNQHIDNLPLSSVKMRHEECNMRLIVTMHWDLNTQQTKNFFNVQFPTIQHKLMQWSQPVRALFFGVKHCGSKCRDLFGEGRFWNPRTGNEIQWHTTEDLNNPLKWYNCEWVILINNTLE
uniref:F-box domain-containing protein n=1 Tax=Ditylenchus dipsaci TaxID=166011 RepID=A0A915D9M6_9BILA